ncbi:MAG: sodium:solute symporter family protein [Candidatus Hydrogenedentes bacterium]|nr:sodium:solute symporter family protein [Candidatus Hydrogenedentota bacterium]
MILGINVWDWLTLFAYLIGITAIGVWTARKVKDTADFFIGGRRFGKAFMVFFAFGAGTNGNQAVAVAAKTYSNGLSGIWYQFLWLFATPFYWIIAPVFRRMRAVTTGDFFQYRYGGYTDALYAIFGPLQLVVNIGVMLVGSGAVIEAISGGAISKEFAIGVMTALFVIYGVAGGLAAAIVTDFVQGILTVLLSFMLLPFALKAVGGFTGLHAGITDPGMFSLVDPGEINLFHIIMFATNALVGIVVQPHIMGVCAGGRNEMDGRVGFAGGNLLKRVCTVAWMLTGLCAVVMYTHLEPGEADLVYGKMANDLLPKVMPGLVGLFLAALLASLMSSCDAFMVSSSGLFTQNLYRRYLVTDKPDKHYVLVGRIVSLVIVAGSLYFAYMVKDVPSGLEMFWKMAAMMGAAFWVGLFWRRATAAGVWASTIVAFVLMIVTSLGFFHDWAAGTRQVQDGDTVAVFAERYGVPVEEVLLRNELEPDAELKAGKRLEVVEPALPDRMIWDGQFRVSYQMFLYLVAGFATCILVSLFTRRVPKEQLDRFYNCLRTPVGDNEPHLEPFSLPEGVEPGPADKLIDHPDLEIPKPSLVGMAGFGFFWLMVFGMIGFVYWMAGWGA